MKYRFKSQTWVAKLFGDIGGWSEVLLMSLLGLNMLSGSGGGKFALAREPQHQLQVLNGSTCCAFAEVVEAGDKDGLLQLVAAE